MLKILHLQNGRLSETSLKLNINSNIKFLRPPWTYTTQSEDPPDIRLRHICFKFCAQGGGIKYEKSERDENLAFSVVDITVKTT